MANHLLTKVYNDVLRILEVTDPGHANTFNPLFKQLANNDAYLKDIVDTIKNGELTIPELDTLSKSISGAINELKKRQDSINSQMLESIGHGIISGLKVIPQLPSSMSVTVTSGIAYLPGGSRIELTSNTTILVNSADTVNQRIDAIYLDKTGNIKYTAGIPASKPVIPEIPNDSILLSGIHLSANAASITESNIIDDRKMMETLEKLSTDFNDFRAEVSTQMADKANNVDATRKTAAKDVTGAINELFTNANNLKSDWADVIGSPLLPTDTSAQLKSKTQTIKNTLATNLINKGQSALNTESLTSLSDKVANIKIGDYSTGDFYKLRKPFTDAIYTYDEVYNSLYIHLTDNFIYSMQLLGRDLVFIKSDRNKRKLLSFSKTADVSNSGFLNAIFDNNRMNLYLVNGSNFIHKVELSRDRFLNNTSNQVAISSKYVRILFADNVRLYCLIAEGSNFQIVEYSASDLSLVSSKSITGDMIIDNNNIVLNKEVFYVYKSYGPGNPYRFIVKKIDSKTGNTIAESKITFSQSVNVNSIYPLNNNTVLLIYNKVVTCLELGKIDGILWSVDFTNYIADYGVNNKIEIFNSVADIEKIFIKVTDTERVFNLNTKTGIVTDSKFFSPLPTSYPYELCKIYNEEGYVFLGTENIYEFKERIII